MKETAKRTLFGARVILLVATVLLFLPAALAPAIAAISAGAPSNSRAIRSKVLVTGVRSTSSDGYARITVDLSQETKFEVGRLLDNLAKGAAPRIYVDIYGAQLAVASKQPVQVDNDLVRQVRIGQYSADVVRVVLDLQNRTAHNAFMVADPYRLIIDVAGERHAAGSDNSARRTNQEPATRKPPQTTNKMGAPTAVSNGLRKVVLDPGHGGKDPGALGPGGIAEKEIVLSIAKKLAVKLKTEMGTEVVLTRKDDRFIPLEDRTLLANSQDADLFISLHVNASPNADARGIETYYLDNTTDEAAIRLAARENATSRKNISDLQFILSDMMQNMKLEDSITLAHRLQAALVSGMGKFMGDVKDLGVKKALFHVLVGARMPSVLVEMFFITNKNESRAMADPNYQDAMVDALFEGIQKYAQSNLMAKTL
ncbi:MAG: N-acetylmuramoyl-L-alanine amidase [Candidatus Binatia bacterium]